MINLKLDINKSDLGAFYKFAFWQAPNKSSFRKKRRIQNGLGFASFPIVMFFLIGAPFSASMVWNLLFFAAVLFAFGYKLADKFALARMEKEVEKLVANGKNQELIGLMSIDLVDGVFIWRTPNSETKYQRKAIEKLEQVQHHYFIFTSSISGYVIPKRFFGSKEEQANFEEWWRATHESES